MDDKPHHKGERVKVTKLQRFLLFLFPMKVEVAEYSRPGEKMRLIVRYKMFFGTKCIYETKEVIYQEKGKVARRIRRSNKHEY